MSFLKNILTGSRGIKAATNVHLAELAIPKLSPDDKHKIMEQMINMWKCTTSQELQYRIESFNRTDRLRQLNYLAIAMYYAGVPSPVPGEVWNYISYPGVNLPDQSDLSVNSDWFNKKRGVHVAVKSNPVDITGWWNP